MDSKYSFINLLHRQSIVRLGNLPSGLEDIGVLRDAKYEVLDLGGVINLQSPPEDHNHVDHTPNMDQHVNESPKQKISRIRSSCPPSLPRLSSARKRTPRCIHVDESCLSSLEGNFPKPTIYWKCRKLMNEYFESKGNVGKCKLLLCLLKSNCLVVVRRILGIKMVIISEDNNHIVRNLQSTFNAIGKTSRTKDLCVARRVLSELVVSKSTRQRCLLSHTS